MLRTLDKRKKTTLLGIISCVLLLVALLASASPSISVIQANFSIGTLNIGGLDEVSTKRSVQSYYLGYGIYIPISDIIVAGDSSIHDGLHKQLGKLCGEGRVYIWTPLRFKIPIFGERLIEWCQIIG